MDLIIYLLLIGFIPFLVWLVALHVRDRKKRHQNADLNENGETIFAEITGIQQEDIFFRNIVMVRIVAKYSDKGEEYSFVSDKFYPDDIKGLKLGDHVQIRVNKHNFSRYQFNMTGPKTKI